MQVIMNHIENNTRQLVLLQYFLRWQFTEWNLSRTFTNWVTKRDALVFVTLW